MSVNIVINGFGRMGRLFFRAAQGLQGVQVVHINDLAGSASSAAHLLQFDSVHGTWDKKVKVESKDSLSVEGKVVGFSSESQIEKLPWSALGCDVVVDCTGKNKSLDSLAQYLDHCVSRVLVSSPLSDPKALNVVMGVNEALFSLERDRIISAASCTTNALAPVVKVVQEKWGIKHGGVTTIHNVTNTQKVVDAFHHDLRRARSSSVSLIPTSTGSAEAISYIFPDLKGKLSSIAIRVPQQNSSLIDCVFELQKNASAEEVNSLLKEASETGLQGILGYEERPLVSADFVNNPHASVIDALMTQVINGTQLKLLAWYDNEWGYVSQMVRLLRYILEREAGELSS